MLSEDDQVDDLANELIFSKPVLQRRCTERFSGAFIEVQPALGFSNKSHESACSELSDVRAKKMIRSLTPSSEQLASLGLRPGENRITFTVKSRL